jgi:hypothetical protein
MKLFKGQDNSGTDTAQDYRVSPSSSVATKTVVHVPAAATKATVNVAATPGVRHVCAGISASIATAGTAQTPLTITLYDGDVATGVVKWAGKVAAPANSRRGGNCRASRSRAPLETDDARVFRRRRRRVRRGDRSSLLRRRRRINEINVSRGRASATRRAGSVAAR